jgi:pimeloyl-ACP methyl ester carboxylesterase
MNCGYSAAAINGGYRPEAPYKELILIPDAGHFALLTAQQAFCSALSDSVRPIAVARGA